MQKSLARWDCIISDKKASWYSVGTKDPSRPDDTESSWPAGNWQQQKIKNKTALQPTLDKLLEDNILLKTIQSSLWHILLLL